MLQKKRLIVALLFATVLAIVFWSQSRVPALNEKAQMGLRTNVSAIAFDTVLPVNAAQPLVERVARSSVNWAYTNWRGMTFGLLFAALALTILGNIGRRSFKKPWLNTLAGAAVGAPLGVCVNCATPIAHGIYSAGARLETALAALISSPTLNVIVLTMSFTLLPWELALAKLFGVLVFLSSIPFLVRRFAASPNLKAAGALAGHTASQPLVRAAEHSSASGDESYGQALRATTGAFFANLVYIVKVALPFMLLAGVIGALVVEVVPFDLFAQANASPLIMFVGAIVATVVPVPIAFDVIIVMALLSSGIDAGLACVLLFGLGIYSIYPAFVIARYISVPLSLALAATVIVLASLLGFATQGYFARQALDEQQRITEGLNRSSEAAYGAAVQICDSVPERLQVPCFRQVIDAFGGAVAADEFCRTRPGAIEHPTCREMVDARAAEQQALNTSTTTPCNSLPTQTARLQCLYVVVSQLARSNDDINFCSQLPIDRMVSDCRAQYLNARLLFNPHESACSSLSGDENAQCRTNAVIYSLADAANMDGCGELDNEGLRDHCRYVVASAMIGRQNDPSGCLQITSPVQAEQCKSLMIGWRAERDSAPELCSELGAGNLRDTCLLRVAAKEIRSVVAEYTLSPLPDGIETAGAEGRSTKASPVQSSPQIDWKSVSADDQVEISYAPFNASATVGTTRFQRIAARDLGITQSWNFRGTDFFEPFIIGKGIASGDFNDDLWPDLAFATERGVAIYQNIGGQFELADINQGKLTQANLFLVAFVDADSDGRQDLFASAYGGRNYLLINFDGGFQQTELIEFEGDHRLTLSAGFADLDQNGELDIALGNWSNGSEKLFTAEYSANQILFREGDRYRTETLDEVKGETNSLLLADINGDHLTDLLVGNDWNVPDVYYLGRGDGKLEQISAASERFPVTTMFTMSLDAADFNNDLEPDLFATDMTFARSSQEDYCAQIQDADSRLRCGRLLQDFERLRTGSAVACAEQSSPRKQRDCYAAFSVKAAKSLKDRQYCDRLADYDPSIYTLCQHLASPIPAEEAIDQALFFPQAQRNVLLMGGHERFVEVGEAYGVDSSFWSWNAKAADLDNDGWQDIYIGNGFHFGDSFYEIQENVLFHNIEGQRFEEVAAGWGLNDTLNTPSYTYLDLDLDGDLDIVATGVLAPPRVFINQHDSTNAVTILLSDERGNSAAIGAKVTIRYGGAENKRQRKENKLSGGFMSFDNPVVHFGLGKYTSIDEVSVHWPDGETTVHNLALPATGIYRIRRLGR